MSLVFFAVEKELFGPSPFAGHLFNMFFFGLCVIVLFRFLNHLFDRKKTNTAFIASLLFAIHPIHTEVVANIKSFDAILCFLFAFIALNLFLNYFENGKKAGLLFAVISLFLSLISKEDSITLIFLVPLIFIFYKNTDKKRTVEIIAGTMFAAISFLVLRYYILNVNNNTTANLSFIQNALVNAPDFSTRLATCILILGYYIRFMFFPYPLICDYSFSSIPFAHFTDPVIWFILIAAITCIYIAVKRLIKYKKDLVSFGIIFFLVTISLFSNLFFLIGSEMSERFTFLPSVGFCLLAATGIQQLTKLKFINQIIPDLPFRFIIAGIGILLTFLTISRNNEWEDNYTLHFNDLQKAPENSHLNYCVGYALIDSIFYKETNILLKQEVLNEGTRYLSKAVQVNPEYTNAQAELGKAFLLGNQFDSAERHFNIALASEPFNIPVLNNKSELLFRKKDYDGAIAASHIILSINPTFAKSYSNIGLCYYIMGKYDSAIIYLNKSIKMDPGLPLSYPNLALTYNKTGNIDSSRKYTAIARRYYPNFEIQL